MFREISTDCITAVRAIRRHRAFSAMALIAAAVPIAVMSTIFTAFNGLYLDSLPFPAPERLVFLHESMPSRSRTDLGVSRAILTAWQKNNRSFESISLYQENGASLAGTGQEAARLKGASVTWDLGKTLGVRPILGRDFTPEDDRPGAPCVMLVGYDLWRAGLGAAPDIIGKRLTVDLAPCAVIGVLPRSAIFPAGSEYWIPIGAAESDSIMVWDGVGRLKAQVTPEAARADLLRIDSAGSVFARFPTAPTVERLRERFVGHYRPAIRLLFVAAMLVLLAACANLAGLFFARGAARRREFAIRTAVGASGYRLARQVFAEALLLSTAAGAAGGALGWAGIRLMIATAHDVIPSWVRFQPDWRVFLAVAAAILAVTILSAAGPAFAASRLDTRSSLASTAPALTVSRRWIGLMISGQAAFATALLICAGLVLDDARRVLAADPGFRPERAMTFGLNPTYSDKAQLHRFYEGMLAGLRGTSGIDAVAGANWLPPEDRFRQAMLLLPEGSKPLPAGAAPLTAVRTVTRDYFRAMGIRLVEGRELQDGPGDQDAMVISESLARQYWPGSAAVVGKRVVSRQRTAKTLTVIGVARDVRQNGADAAAPPIAYLNAGQIDSVWFYFVVRGGLDSRSMVSAVRSTVRRLDPGLAVFEVLSLQERIDRGLGPRRAWTLLFGVFGIAGLMLAMAGTYGVIAYSVSHGTREIGIRMALGARAGKVAGAVFLQCAVWAGAGVALGIAGSMAASPLMARILAETSPASAEVRVVAAGVLIMVALLAGLGPAMRAASVDPIQALRSE